MSRRKTLPALILLMLAVATNLFGQAQEKVLYSFGSSPGDGLGVPNGGLLFDKVGNIYGTTQFGAPNGGNVFELSPQANGTWAESILYSFCPVFPSCVDGQTPKAGLISDSTGNLYGTTYSGGAYNNGVVFELSPPPLPGGTWTESVLWSFGGPTKDGTNPMGRLTMDAQGNLYGTTVFNLQGGGGTVFELSRSGNNSWAETVLYSFCVNQPPTCPDGKWPEAGVSFDKSGNLYGTTWQGGAGTGACCTSYRRPARERRGSRPPINSSR